MDARTVGLIANPASGRDIRRIVALGGNVTTNEKLNLIERLFVGLAAAGVESVVSMVDRSGLSAGVERMAARTSSRIPAVQFLDHEITRTSADTAAAAAELRDLDVGCLVVLGGDGTHRHVAAHCGDVPLVGLSTGTNNAFPAIREPTVAGLAAGLVAAGAVEIDAVSYRAKSVVVEIDGRTEAGLVDVAVTSDDSIGAGAMWDPGSIDELFLAFAEPHTIGLSSVGGLTRPCDRRDPHGLHVQLGPGRCVKAPIAPGLVAELEVADVTLLAMGEQVPVRAERGVVAIDGEKEIRFGHADRPVVHIAATGPRVVEIERVMATAAERGWSTRPRVR